MIKGVAEAFATIIVSLAGWIMILFFPPLALILVLLYRWFYKSTSNKTNNQ